MSERTELVIGWRRRVGDWLSYGAEAATGKALALCLILCVALGPGLAVPASAGAAGDEVTVLAFGDSLTQGYGLAQGDGFVPRLNAWLADHGIKARVVNGGVSGETTAGGSARADWSLTPDIDAVILELGANDMLRGIDPAVTRANLSAILKATAARGMAVLLVRVPATGNFGAAYKAQYDAIFPDLAAQFGTLYYPDFFAGLGVDSPDEARPYLQSDGLHPNARGVVRIVAAIGPAVERLIAAVR